ncbi:bifunctional heparan sulfate N-deacetylase/N-sulfotransferase-like, partial [Pollicipes pollicipes]|uniref:bifunctional heparan sulfate N-deacetylase/N-sulfotransferase-like n=1 Tax=Pollicipes pollicipes TaxID=41117 RepID=UPI001884AA71
TDGRHRSAARLRLEAKVLLYLETQYSPVGRDLTALLTANGFRFKTVTSSSLPLFTSGDRGRYSVIVFESYAKYLAMDSWNRAIMDKYCKEYDVGIVAFMPTQEDSLHGAELTGSGLRIHTNLALQDAELNPDSPVLRIARAGETLRGPVPGRWHILALGVPKLELHLV